MYTDVMKQVMFTNNEQESIPLPVCNIPAVTHYIDRWVLIGCRVEPNKTNFCSQWLLSEGVSPPSVASFPILSISTIPPNWFAY
jgi:hypothetical protein